MTVDSREFGMAQAKIDNLEKITVVIGTEVREIRGAVFEIRETLAVARGAWKSVAWAAGMIGAILGTFLSHFVTKVVAQGRP